MNVIKARKAAVEARDMLQEAHWTAREVQAILPGATMDALLDQLHSARLALEQVRTALEKQGEASAEPRPGSTH